MCSFKKFCYLFGASTYVVLLAWYGIGLDLYPMDEERYANLKKNYPRYSTLCESDHKGEIAVVHFVKKRNSSLDIMDLFLTFGKKASHPVAYLPWIGKLSEKGYFDSSEQFDSILVMRHRTVRDLFDIVEEFKKKGLDINVVFEKNEQWVTNGFYVGWLTRILLGFLVLQVFHCIPWMCCSKKKSAELRYSY